MTGSADLVGLRAIAEAATPSVWHVVSEALDQGSPWVENEKGWTVAETGGHLINARNNAHYIATFSPAVVIALIDRLSAAEANLLAVRGALEETEVWLTACLECETWQWDADQHDAATACRDRARSALTSPISREGEDRASVAESGGSRAAPVKSDSDGGPL